jgi:hypothetical protein
MTPIAPHIEAYLRDHLGHHPRNIWYHYDTMRGE